MRAGRVNVADERTSRTLDEILRANILTRFNAILGTVFVLILVFGEGQDALFGFVLVVQRADRHRPGVAREADARPARRAARAAGARRARRRGRGGRRSPRSCSTISATSSPATRSRPTGSLRVVDGLELDESMLTGESDPVAKDEGDEVLSGSIVVAGRGRFQVTRVGADAYARRLATEARRFTLTRSELIDGINQILRYVQWAMVPTAILLAFSQFRCSTRPARRSRVSSRAWSRWCPKVSCCSRASRSGSRPDAGAPAGAGAGAPGGRGLARVDVILLDKTGTLTEGVIRFDSVHEIEPDDPVVRRAGRARRRRESQRDDERAVRGVPRARRLGREPARRRSRRAASGARRPSASAARGCSARRRWCGSTAPHDDPVRVDGRPARGRRAAGPAARAHRRARSSTRSCPTGSTRRRCSCSRADPGRRGRHAALLRRAGRARAWSSPATTRTRSARSPRRVGVAGRRSCRSTRASCPTIPTSSATCSKTSRCSDACHAAAEARDRRRAAAAAGTWSR